MRTFPTFRAPVSLLAFVAACSSGAAPPPLGTDGGTSGTDATTTADAGKTPPRNDGGKTDAATSVFVNGTYTPPGCSYTVTPQDTVQLSIVGTATGPLGYTALSADDNASAGPASTAAPLRVRLGLGGNTTSGSSGYPDPTTTAAFTWETGAANTAAKVKFGTSPTSLTKVQSGYNWTVPANGSISGAAYFHEVDVCGLTPATTYYYQVGGGAAGSEIWSATQSFTTVPSTGKITVGVFGDARDLVSTWQLVHERMKDAAPNLMLVSGDIVDIGQQESLYTQWLSAIWNPDDAGAFITLGQFMMVPVAGNHEQDTAQFFANFPIPGEGDYAKQFDSFDVGNTHFVMIDDQQVAEAPTSDAANAILTWLDADLAAANADRTAHPFIVAISHRGVYSTSNHAVDSDVIQARLSMVPLFDKYHVNLVMNGHDHEYERTYPLNAGTPASAAPVVVSSLSQGTTYVINAGAGADPYAVGQYPSNYREGAATPLGTLSTKGYLGCYALLTLEGTTLVLTAYGMKAGGGGVAGDDVIDTLTFGQ